MSKIYQDLYASYVSGFKAPDLYSQCKIQHLWLWYDAKIGTWLRDIPKDAHILEIGCGAGYMLGYLQKKGYRNVIGIDLAPEYVKIAQARGYNAILADALEYLPQHANHYDVIIALDVLEHFTLDDGYKLCLEIYQALGTQGRLLIQTANGAGLFPNYVMYGDLTHRHIYSNSSLKQLLTLVNFHNVEFRETGPAPLIHFPLYVAWQVIRLLMMGIKLIETGRLQTLWTENLLCLARKGEIRNE